MKTRVGVVATAGLALSIVVAGSPAFGQTDEAKRVRDATLVFSEIMRAPDKAIPGEILARAEGIAVFPGLLKAGFVFGGEHGRGILSVRDHATGRWSRPAFLTMSGGSWGAQIGGEVIDLVLVVMNRRGLSDLISDKFRLGGEASAAAGPVGRHVGASTDLKLTAQILSYSRSRGLFAGAAIDGAVVQPDIGANRAFYGGRLTTAEIVGPINSTASNASPSASEGTLAGTSGLAALTPADDAAVISWQQALSKYSVAWR